MDNPETWGKGFAAGVVFGIFLTLLSLSLYGACR
jgi:hypothetical protein